MDRYQIYESIGSSTHSIVYKARERKTIRFVAVRSTDKSQRQKVVHEVRTMARMQHENVAQAHLTKAHVLALLSPRRSAESAATAAKLQREVERRLMNDPADLHHSASAAT